MLNLDPAKLFVILVVALIVLGPERLPKVARQLGAAWRELSRVRDEISEEVRSALASSDALPSLKVPYRAGVISDFIRSASSPSTGKAPSGEDEQASTPTSEVGESATPETGRRQLSELPIGLDDPSMN